MRLKIAARSSQGVALQVRLACRAASMAMRISASPGLVAVAQHVAVLVGADHLLSLPVRTSWPPMMSGMSSTWPYCRSSSALSRARSGVPGA